MYKRQWLNRFMKMGGVDAEGNATDTCALVGTVRLTNYVEDERYEALKACLLYTSRCV